MGALEESLNLRGLSVSFGETKVLDRQNLSFDVGVTVVTGANGSGKSTLLKVAAGELVPSVGSVMIGSRHVSEVERRRDFSYLPQKPRLPDRLRVGNLLEYALWLRGVHRDKIAERTDWLLRQTQLGDRRRDRVSTLSVGMRQRVAIAAYLCDPGPVMLLDEPSAALDGDSQEALHAMLQKRGSRSVVVVATHDSHDVAGLAGRVMEVRAGSVWGSSGEGHERE